MKILSSNEIIYSNEINQSVICFVGVVDAQYAMQVHLSTLASLEGGEVTVTCDVSIRQTNKSFFIIWVKRTHGEEVEIGTNDHINGIFNNTGRYKARYELHRPNDFTRVTFYLKITSELNRFLSTSSACIIYIIISCIGIQIYFQLSLFFQLPNQICSLNSWNDFEKTCLLLTLPIEWSPVTHENWPMNWTDFITTLALFWLACTQQTHCGMHALIFLHTQIITRAGNLVYVRVESGHKWASEDISGLYRSFPAVFKWLSYVKG